MSEEKNTNDQLIEAAESGDLENLRCLHGAVDGNDGARREGAFAGSFSICGDADGFLERGRGSDARALQFLICRDMDGNEFRLPVLFDPMAQALRLRNRPQVAWYREAGP